MRKVLLWVVVLLFSFCFVSGQPPFEVSTTDYNSNVLTIVYPEIEVFAKDVSVDFPSMIINASGSILTNDSVSCYFSIFNSDLGIIRDNELLTFDNNRFIINDLNTSVSGFYTYGIFCNTSSGGGFVQGYYWVGEDADVEMGENVGGLVFLAVIPLFVALLLVVGGVSLSNEDHPFVKVFLYLVSFPFVFVSMQLGSMVVSRFYNYPEVVDVVGNFTLWFTWLWALIVVYFLIYSIYVIVRQAAQDKEARLNY